VSNTLLFTPALLRTHSVVFFVVHETRRIFLCPFISKVLTSTKYEISTTLPTGLLTRVDDLPGRRTLRSTNDNRLVVPSVKLSTVGSRAFAIAAPHVWNTLPTDVVAANPLSTFRRRLLKCFLFKQSYHDIIYTDIIQLVVLAVVAPLRPLLKSTD